MIVAVDGPGGTGKTSVSRALARLLGLPHLDTGAFYRAATVAVLAAGADPAEPVGSLRAVTGSRIQSVAGAILLDGRDVTEEIRSEAVERNVSAVSAHPEVRALLVSAQRDWVDEHGGSAVVEGRDIGSMVFPDAEVKVYLTARPEVRARRRALESGVDDSETAEALTRRDHLDSTRAASPLIVPPGAVVIDTSDMSIDQVIETVAGLVTTRS
ncbi:MAG: (d)CMP kinase [Actinobacteria bacterium]|nr:(d)CMP kinase [Actinomycetota bacterium]MCI0679596.1 (d)CMP kinase [Actinomycetota bacterium]